MSHFVLTVCMTPPPEGVSIGNKLGNMLAPYDENTEVEPYRDYENGEAADNWWYKALKSDHKAFHANDRSKLRPYNPDLLGWSSAESRQTLEEQWEDVKRDAEVFETLPDPITWEALTAAHNRYYCEGFPHSEEYERRYYDPEEGKQYELRTYNPLSKWDWYQIGGRWSNYFPMRSGIGSEGVKELIRGERSFLSGEPSAEKATWVDGGPKKYLDLDLLRERKADEVQALWQEFHDVVSHLPEALGWSAFRDMVEKDIYSIDRARELYREQPRKRALMDSAKFKWDFDCSIDRFGNDETDDLLLSLLKEKARQEAVPGYALMTTEGDWIAPGSMGWFGMSSESEEDMSEFKRKANEYIESLPEDTILLAVDLHI